MLHSIYSFKSVKDLAEEAIKNKKCVCGKSPVADKIFTRINTKEFGMVPLCSECYNYCVGEVNIFDANINVDEIFKSLVSKLQEECVLKQQQLKDDATKQLLNSFYGIGGRQNGKTLFGEAVKESVSKVAVTALGMPMIPAIISNISGADYDGDIRVKHYNGGVTTKFDFGANLIRKETYRKNSLILRPIISETIERVIVQENGMTIILWTDGIKTYSKPSCEFHNFDKGLIISVLKRLIAYNSTNQLNNYMKRYGTLAYSLGVLKGILYTVTTIKNDKEYEKFKESLNIIRNDLPKPEPEEYISDKPRYEIEYVDLTGDISYTIHTNTLYKHIELFSKKHCSNVVNVKCLVTNIKRTIHLADIALIEVYDNHLKKSIIYHKY